MKNYELPPAEFEAWRNAVAENTYQNTILTAEEWSDTMFSNVECAEAADATWSEYYRNGWSDAKRGRTPAGQHVFHIDVYDCIKEYRKGYLDYCLAFRLDANCPWGK
jgi:hypothetical protein